MHCELCLSPIVIQLETCTGREMISNFLGVLKQGLKVSTIIKIVVYGLYGYVIIKRLGKLVTKDLPYLGKKLLYGLILKGKK